MLRHQHSDNMDVDSASAGSEADEPEMLNVPRKSFTKLETISSAHVRRLLRVIHGCMFFGLVAVIVYVSLARSMWSLWSPTLDAEVLDLPKWATVTSFACKAALAAGLGVLGVAYGVQLARLDRRDRLHEQFWVVVLIVTALVYVTTLAASAFGLVRHAYELGDWYMSVDWLLLALGGGSFMVSVLLYFWLSAASFGLLKGNLEPLFYVTRLSFVMVLAFVYVIALYVGRVLLVPVPFLSVLSMLRILTTDVSLESKWIAFILAYSLLEVLVVVLIFRDVRQTRSLLASTSYTRYRTKQVGFRFFLYTSLAFWVCFWTAYAVFVLAAPLGPNYVLADRAAILYLDHAIKPMGLAVIFVSFIVLETYVRSPAQWSLWWGRKNSIGDRQFSFQDSQNFAASEIEVPIGYKKREFFSSDPFEVIQPTTFVLQTHVSLFNFAWYVYYFGTQKEDRLKINQELFRFRVHKYVTDARSDTHALIVDGTDRIIVSFRGTSSKKNLRTDLAVNQVRLDGVIPSDPSMPPDARLARCRVHRGFARAYSTVSAEVVAAVGELYREKKRPILLTGHSLGGSLATLCSLDLVLSLRLGTRRIGVTTFGTPKVGNGHFVGFYNQVVLANWRVVLSPDVVSKLPKLGYSHTGKKVLLTPTGQLFLDPNALELKMWNGEAVSVVYHRKASYLLAMTRWCALKHGEAYTPEFWSWPYTADDLRRFDEDSASTLDGPSSVGIRASTSRFSWRRLRPPSSTTTPSAPQSFRMPAPDSMRAVAGARGVAAVGLGEGHAGSGSMEGLLRWDGVEKERAVWNWRRVIEAATELEKEMAADRCWTEGNAE